MSKQALQELVSAVVKPMWDSLVSKYTQEEVETNCGTFEEFTQEVIFELKCQDAVN